MWQLAGRQYEFVAALAPAGAAVLAVTLLLQIVALVLAARRGI